MRFLPVLLATISDLPFPLPNPSRRVPDVDDSNRVSIHDPVKDLVPIASDDLHADVRVVRPNGTVRLFGDGSNAVMDRVHDVARTGRTPLFDISIDLVNICKRARSVDNSHVTPWRFQNF
jgi:hypothetical protein